MLIRESPGSTGASASYARLLPVESAEAKLSDSAVVAEVEGADPVAARIGPVEEARVDAALARALARLLDLEGAAGRRIARQPHRAEARPRALGLAEELHVDLRREHLVHAAHEAATAQRLVVAVEEWASLGDAGRGAMTRSQNVEQRRHSLASVWRTMRAMA